MEAAPRRSSEPHRFLFESSGLPSLLARSGQKRPDPQLRRHQPHQTAGEGFLPVPPSRSAPPASEGHRPSRLVDGPGAMAVAGGDLPAQGAPQSAACSRRDRPRHAPPCRGQPQVIAAQTWPKK